MAAPRGTSFADREGGHQVICTWPGCTGVHDNNRYADLCPRSRHLKALKDLRYQGQTVIAIRRDSMARRRRFEAAESDYASWLDSRGCPSQYDRDPALDGLFRKADESFRRRAKRQRPKVPTICTRLIPITQVLADTANPARTLGVL
jgi:hypothetical protein